MADESSFLVNDGTPHFGPTVEASYRKLQVRTSIYDELPPKGAGIRLAIYQAQGACGDNATEQNLARLELAVEKAKHYHAQAVSFPELYLQGYTHNPETAHATAETCDGPSITRIREIAKKHKIGVIVSYGERVDREDRAYYYDSIAVIDEHGALLDSYKKCHLYGQQERDNWDIGDSEYPVHKIAGFPVGVVNCYECEFPELMRILALKGAKLIVGPTAADTYYRLPDGRMSSVPYPDVAKVQFPAHAYSNNLFFAYVNRCGYETRDGDSWHYRGNSMVCSPHGEILVAAHNEQDTLLVCDCVPAYYGRTHPAPAYHYLKDRRPELYGQLLSKDAKFIDTSNGPLTESTDLFGGEFSYE
ncbi:nitrilase-related carbon-nitrogen hydrolase [Cerasicoccus frondis]|uniref:nitrilase-related carbon-nitrogen hydrolase n=1 Tax=Cerasicoccus frondis TaxID=490090 RepID=UPI002852BEC7|nr:nitrilase-related carbon-nitrogen hydrolase [Cerasicoccus frondis]